MPNVPLADADPAGATASFGSGAAIVAAWFAAIGGISLTAGLHTLKYISNEAFIVAMVLLGWFVLGVSRWVRADYERRNFSPIVGWLAAMLVVGSTVAAGAIVATVNTKHPWPVLVMGGAVLAITLVVLGILGKRVQRRQTAPTTDSSALLSTISESDQKAQ